MLQGCHGGDDCVWTDPATPSWPQICSLAYLSLHLGTPAWLTRHRPHRNCQSWNPCNGSPGGTDCPGTNLVSGSWWNSTGQSLMSQMLSYRANLAMGCDCYGNHCPEVVAS